MLTYLTDPERLRSLISKLSPAETAVLIGVSPSHQFPEVVTKRFEDKLFDEFTRVLIDAEAAVVPLRYARTAEMV